jgi:hypothetical protein
MRKWRLGTHPFLLNIFQAPTNKFMEKEKFQKGNKVRIGDFPKTAIVIEYHTKKSSTTKFVVIEWESDNEKIKSTVPEAVLRKAD